MPVETARTRLKRGLELLRARLDRGQHGGREAWCLAFVHRFGLVPPGLAPLAAFAAASYFARPSGGLALSVMKTTALASDVLAASVSPFVFVRDAESRTMPTHTTVGAPAEAPVEVITAGSLTAIAAAPGTPVALALVPDRALRGRLVDLEGQPILGVDVRVAMLGATPSGSLDAFLADPLEDEPSAYLVLGEERLELTPLRLAPAHAGGDH